MLGFRVYGRADGISGEWDLEHPTHQRIVRFSMSGDEPLGTRGNPEQ
jgi:hypothetical protein